MKPVFIIGTGRCGSTLIHEILAKHEHSSFLSAAEENYRRLAPLTRWANQFYRSESMPFGRKLSKTFMPTEGYGLIDQQVSPIYSRPNRDLRASDATPWLNNRFRTFFKDRYDRNRCPVLVHKYTGWSRLGFFSKIFPEAKFVHIVRDGRAVANSWLQMRWWSGYQGPGKWLWADLSDSDRMIWENNNRSFITLAGLCWNMLIQSFLDWEEHELDQENFMEVKYEDILDHPTEEISKLLDFCGLDWSKDFERQLASFEIRDTRKAAYYDDLGLDNLKELEEVISERLAHFDYDIN